MKYLVKVRRKIEYETTVEVEAFDLENAIYEANQTLSFVKFLPSDIVSDTCSAIEANRKIDRKNTEDV
jgi:hypothetical protein